MYYNFNPNLPEPLNVIHPLQVKSVERLLQNKFPDVVKAIILFGSSLQLYCHPHSDLDLYVVADTEDYESVYAAVRAVCLTLKKPFDILVADIESFKDAFDEMGTIESEIVKNGVCIYAA